MTNPNSAALTEVTSLFEPDALDVARLASVLEALKPADRVRAIQMMRKRTQSALFEAAADRPVRIGDLVPADNEPLREVVHEGRNTLPVFTQFQKRFARSAKAGGHPLLGYNHQTLAPLTGPGYFVAYETGSELTIDYTEVPDEACEGWPTIRPNTGIGGLVFGGMKDVLRGVSATVTIGRAFRKNKPQDNWFVLCRV